jgi:hypothetical protein
VDEQGPAGPQGVAGQRGTVAATGRAHSVQWVQEGKVICFRRVGDRGTLHATLRQEGERITGTAPDSRATSRALIMLAAAGQNGVPQRLLSAHGLSVVMIGGLVNRGLATITRQNVRAGGKLAEMGKVWIIICRPIRPT